MDIEKLIERLYTKQQSYASYTDSEFAHVLEDAITALSTLQVENEELQAELEQAKEERDVAVEYLRGQCRYCKRNLVCTSRKGPHSNCWEWRGLKEE